MHVLKICALVILVLAVMRIASWAIGWTLAKWVPTRTKPALIVANSLAFAIFLGLLIRDLMPGEPIDPAAVLFGLVVYTLCCWADLQWTPWKSK